MQEPPPLLPSSIEEPFSAGFASGHEINKNLDMPQSTRPLSASASTLRSRPSYHTQDPKSHQRHSRHKSASYVTSSTLQQGIPPLKRNGSSGHLGGSTQAAAAAATLANRPPQTQAQRRRRANLLRVRIERGLMVGMGLLAGYRMMTLDYSYLQQLWQDQDGFGLDLTSSESTLSRNWPSPATARPVSQSCSSSHATSSRFVLLTLTHALFLTAHDHRLQFPLHKNQPLQPLQKRSSRYLKSTASRTSAATVAAAVADSDDDSDDDDHVALRKELLQESQINPDASGQGGASGSTGGAGKLEPIFGSFQSRWCRSAEGAMPQWRVWGSEAHWYRKGADNGSIFATVLVPIVLAAKFVQTVTDEKFSTTGIPGLQTAESVLSNLALSLTFGFSVLVHLLLLKVFDSPAGSGIYGKTGGPKPSILDGILLPSSMMTMSSASTPSTSMSTHNLSSTSVSTIAPLTPAVTSTSVESLSTGGNLYPKEQRQKNPISSPSSPSSPTLSAASSGSLSAIKQRQQELQDAFMFSNDQMNHHHHQQPQHHHLPSLFMSSPSSSSLSETERSSDREEVWIIALGFGGAYNFLITLLARFKWIPGLEKTGAGMVMLNHIVFQALMIGFAYFYRRSFTFGELTILAQVITLLIHETLIMAFMTPSPAFLDATGSSWTESSTSRASTAVTAVLENPQFLFLLTLVVGMLMIGVLLTPVLMYCRKLAQMPTKGASLANLQKREFKKKLSAAVVYSGLIVIILVLIMPRCERVLGQNPFLWVIEFMLFAKVFPKPATEDSPAESLWDINRLMSIRIGWSRLGLCLYWVLAVGCSIAFFYWMNTSISRRSIMGSLNNRRKYYHALAVLMFVPGYLTDEPFMHIAFSVGLAALIFLEYVRYFAVVPFGKEIHLFLVGFLDGRDGGPIILSHLYLLMGCATPVWLAEHHILAGLSGIFSLGVGDAMASIIGKRFGRRRWPGTIKTVEGTIAFVVSVMFAAGTIFIGMWVMSFIFGSGLTSTTASSSTLSSVMPMTGDIVGASATSGGSPSLAASLLNSPLATSLSPFSAPSATGPGSNKMPASTPGFGAARSGVVVMDTTKTSGLPPSFPAVASPSSLRPASLLSFSTWEDWSAVTWSLWGVLRYGLAVSVAAMLEAVSEQNDNLVIPVVMLAMVWLI
ncbi:hypothetical protein BGZ83_004479 [Gryganskiella cystojenkinii]|nr:hypothetical protein BGZ83_004479 [Gryganskiella cystojenkinii]